MRIACVLDDGFEDSEFRKPYDAFIQSGHEVTVIGLKSGELKGMKGQETVKTDTTIDRVSPDDFQALFIPGGNSPDHLRADPRVVAFVQAIDAMNRPIFAVCHGPQLLIAADAIRGRRLTAWKTVQVDLQKMGENVVDEEVVVDDSLVTSRQPADLDAFSRAAIDVMSQMTAGAGAAR